MDVCMFRRTAAGDRGNSAAQQALLLNHLPYFSPFHFEDIFLSVVTSEGKRSCGGVKNDDTNVMVPYLLSDCIDATRDLGEAGEGEGKGEQASCCL